MDAINSSHSADLHADQITRAQEQLASYFERFKGQLALSNLRNVQALIRVCNALQRMLVNLESAQHQQQQDASIATALSYTVNDFLFAAGLDNINMFQLVRYIRQSKAVFKISGFWVAMQKRNQASSSQEEKPLQRSRLLGKGTTTNNNNNNNIVMRDADQFGISIAGDGSTTGALHAMISFLQALTNEDADGRVIIDPGSNTVKYVLLNAAAHFRHVVHAAHAVILASGTLSPIQSVSQLLFPDITPSAIHHFSCGHVVGKERLLALAVGSGPTGKVLDFRHASRAVTETMDELGRFISNICTVVPGGVVVFFPSFSYADQVYQRWKTTGILSGMSSKKKVFQEPRAAGDVESILEEYSSIIHAAIQGDGVTGTSTSSSSVAAASITHSTSPLPRSMLTGALLLSVVGGKLAEGINFGDDLGRCVIMVGLPYPNPSDPELKERLAYIDRLAAQSGGNPPEQGQHITDTRYTISSRDHYSNLCMKAVNQCIGRAIRHRNDYASIVLVDTRYVATVEQDGVKSNAVISKMPEWIRQSLVIARNFGDAYSRLVKFQKTNKCDVL